MANAPQRTDRTNSPTGYTVSSFWFFLLAFVVITVTAVVSAWLLNQFPLRTGRVAGSFLDAGPQFTMLTLVVAVAAYLATSIRILKDRIRSLKKEQKEDDAKVTSATTEIEKKEIEQKRQERLADINERGAAINRLIPAKIFTVILGLLVGFRVLVHPFGFVTENLSLQRLSAPK